MSDTNVQNRAAWLKSKQQYPFIIDEAPTPTPGPKDILVKAHATAINPCDVAVQKDGIIFEKYPTILGEDVTGIVAAVGSAVTRFKPGDRIVAAADELEADFGTFQEYCLVHEALAAHLPSNVSYTDGAVLPLGFCTAGNALYNSSGQGLGLPYPSLNPSKLDKWVLVWAASTSVGCCAIQMLKASGLRVAAVCSAHNHGLVKELGAEQAFDFRSESVVEDIVAGLQGSEMAGVFCAYFDNDQLLKCAEISSKLKGAKKVGTVHPAPEMLPKGAPEGVEMFWNWGSSMKGNEVGVALWDKWLSGALESGQMKCKPDAEVVGKGLDKVQQACDKLKAGVSAKKIVVELV